MKKISIFVLAIFTLVLFTARPAFAASSVDQQTTVKLSQVYYFVGSNNIDLKLPTTKEFSSGSPVWQVQQADGTWSDISYVNTIYYKGCTFSLGIKNYTQSIGKTYRLKMVNSTTNINYYTVPYTLTNLTAPSYSKLIPISY